MNALLDEPIVIPEIAEPAAELWPTPAETTAPQVSWTEADENNRVTAHARMPVLQQPSPIARLTLYVELADAMRETCRKAKIDIRPRLEVRPQSIAAGLRFLAQLDLPEDLASALLQHADRWTVLVFGKLPLINPAYPEYVGILTKTVYFDAQRPDPIRTELRAKLSLLASAITL